MNIQKSYHVKIAAFSYKSINELVGFIRQVHGFLYWKHALANSQNMLLNNFFSWYNGKSVPHWS